MIGRMPVDEIIIVNSNYILDTQTECDVIRVIKFNLQTNK